MEFVTKDSHVVYTKSFKSNDKMTDLRENTFPAYTIPGYILLRETAKDSVFKLHQAEKAYRQIIRTLDDNIAKEDLIAIYQEYRSSFHVPDYTNIKLIGDGIKNENGCWSFDIYPVILGQTKKLTLSIFSEDLADGQYSLAYDDETKTIYLPFLSKGKKVLDRQAVEKVHASHGKIIHELIHWIDDEYGELVKNKELKTDEEYFNDKNEFEAFSKQLLFYIRDDLISRNGTKEQLKQFEKEENIQNYLDTIFTGIYKLNRNTSYDYDGAVMRRFISALSDENKEKLIRIVKEFIKKIAKITKFENNEKELAYNLLLEDIETGSYLI